MGRQLCLLWVLHRDPRECTETELSAHHDSVNASPLGDLRFSGAFLPTLVGTDRYVDDLR